MRREPLSEAEVPQWIDVEDGAARALFAEDRERRRREVEMWSNTPDAEALLDKANFEFIFRVGVYRNIDPDIRLCD